MNGVSCSSVALAGTSIAPNTTPWSSVGASSLAENMYIGTTSSDEHDPDRVDRGPIGAASLSSMRA